MLVSRTPLRLSFLGGRTDLPSFYEQEEGAVVSGTFNRYIHVIVRDTFDESYRLSYAGTNEVCLHVADIQHPIIRHVLKSYDHAIREKTKGRGLEFISVSDVPPGTGLGSSSAFTVSLLHALKRRVGIEVSPVELAAEAARIEIDELKEPIGKQDQYATSIGGLQYIRFLPSGEVISTAIKCTEDCRNRFESALLLFYTGITRSASAILSLKENHPPQTRETLREMKTLADRFKVALEAGQSVQDLGTLLDQGWNLKKTIASGISAPQIDTWYERAMRAGAWGGKILGAGGGGFLMMLAEPEKHATIKQALSDLEYVPVKLEGRGSRIVHSG